MKNLHFELVVEVENQVEMKVQRDNFQRGSLEPLLYVIAIILNNYIHKD